MKPDSIFETEVKERCFGVPLDEPAPCLDCGAPTSTGLYLAAELRPLCPTHHLQLFQGGHGIRLAEALSEVNALGHEAARARVQHLQQHAARQLADWLTLRQAERRNSTEAGGTT